MFDPLKNLVSKDSDKKKKAKDQDPYETAYGDDDISDKSHILSDNSMSNSSTLENIQTDPNSSPEFKIPITMVVSDNHEQSQKQNDGEADDISISETSEDDVSAISEGNAENSDLPTNKTSKRKNKGKSKKEIDNEKKRARKNAKIYASDTTGSQAQNNDSSDDDSKKKKKNKPTSNPSKTTQGTSNNSHTQSHDDVSNSNKSDSYSIPIQNDSNKTNTQDQGLCYYVNFRVFISPEYKIEPSKSEVGIFSNYNNWKEEEM